MASLPDMGSLSLEPMEEEQSEDGDWKIVHVDDYAEADDKLVQAQDCLRDVILKEM
jgi:hypothetical protein